MANHITKAKSHPFVIGIDLGTTNSLVAIAGQADQTRYLPLPVNDNHVEGSLPYLIPVQLIMLPQRNLDGTEAEHILFPSVVFQEELDSPRFVGMGAQEAKYRYQRGRKVFYSVKKDLGTDRDPFYPGAVTPDLNTPVKVSAVVLRAIREALEAKLGQSIVDVPTIITIPASFQSSQRRDTISAAQMAGFRVSEHSLFDEPNAALLAYVNHRRVQASWHHEETVLVFDFGGGTCDISIIDVGIAPVSKKITLRNLALSRFEMLGGDDIDQHLVHTYLADAFYTASGYGKSAWGFNERRNSIWSQLGRIAEALKVRLSKEIDTVVQSRGWNKEILGNIEVSLPPQYISTTRGDILLDQLTLNWNMFQQVMQPFLAEDGAEDANKEYYRITSIFTPVIDALQKANLKPRDISRVLLVGGSSRNPLVEHAIQNYFAEARLERTSDLDMLVAEGAAVHAYLQHIVGHDILAPIAGDTIGLLTEGNTFVPLVQAGALIPYPADGWMAFTNFRVPRDQMTHVDLVVCIGSAARPIHTVQLDFTGTVPRNTPVQLKIRLDGNKVFRLEAFLPDYPHIHVSSTIENPLGTQPMTPRERERTTLEKNLASAQANGTINQHSDDMVALAQVLRELGRYEDALEWISQAIKRTGQDNAHLQDIKASIHFSLGDHDAAHKLWAELANKNKSNQVVAFNAAISAGDLDTKERYVRQTIAAAPGLGENVYLLGEVLRAKGEHPAARAQFEQARQLLEAAVQANPHSRFYLAYLVRAYDQLGQTDRATATRQQYSQIKTDGPIETNDALVGTIAELARR